MRSATAGRGIFPILVLVLAPAGGGVHAATADPVESREGYAEFRRGDELIVDGQRVRAGHGARFEGAGEARDPDSIPLGYEVRLKGTREADGSVLASQLEARPNRLDNLDRRVRTATDRAESSFRRSGRFGVDSSGRSKRGDRLRETGREVDRVRRTVTRLLPPYVDPEEVRVYVVDNQEWNAAAMGNFSIYVFSGLLEDMDDDELAIVLGHEVAHATHEHTRRQFRKAMWVQIAALGVMAGAERKIDDRKTRTLAQLLTVFAAAAYRNGYGRELEDQADRVGLRYAYEAGYDVARGPELWRRFARRYGERSRSVNFFFGNHSLASARASNLEREIALNYTAVRQGAGRRSSLR